MTIDDTFPDLNIDFNHELVDVFISFMFPEMAGIIGKEIPKKGWFWPANIAGGDLVPTVKEDMIGINDTLGAYKIDSWDSTAEGTVIIYTGSVWLKAVAYLSAHPTVTKTVEECFEDLCHIILVREFIHFLLHHYIGFNPLRYEKEDEQYFHEGVTHLIIWHTIKFMELLDKPNASHINDLFLWLVDNQPDDAYRAYTKIKKKDSDIEPIEYEELCKLLKWCKMTGVQSFYAIKPSLKMISIDDWEHLADDDETVDYWVKIYKENHRSGKFSLDELGKIFFRLPLVVQDKVKGYQYARKFDIL